MGLTILYGVLIVLMLIGVLGALVPGIPGSGLILVSILVWGLVKGFAGISWPLIVAFVVLILSTVVELLATYWGVKQVGASHWSQVGALVGLVLGFFGLLPTLPFGGPLVGILLGPVLGCFIGEFLYRREMAMGDRTQLAFKVSIAVIVSSLIGNIVKTSLALAAVITFVWTTWPPVVGA
jgi:uncharacterized protein YqgC (DUF456 family)